MSVKGDDPRVQKMAALVSKMKKTEIQKQAENKKFEGKQEKMNMIWGKKAKQALRRDEPSPSDSGSSNSNSNAHDDDDIDSEEEERAL